MMLRVLLNRQMMCALMYNPARAKFRYKQGNEIRPGGGFINRPKMGGWGDQPPGMRADHR